MNVVSTCKIKSSIKENLRKNYPSVNFSFHEHIDEIKEDLDKVDVLLTYGEGLQEKHIEQASNLKWINVLSAGVDKMPLQAIKKKNILVTNSRGIHKIPMAEYTISMILQVYRSAKVLMENEDEQKWDRKVRMTELSGKTIAVLGTGAIGGEIARIASAFNMIVLGVNRSGRSVDYFEKIYTMEELDEPLSNADIIVSILPSTEETVHLLKREHFQKMKNNALFMNVGRGDLYEEKVLLEALREKEIAHAVLDVFEQEPLDKNHPFWTMDEVTVTPHISSISKNYLERCFEIFEHNLTIFIDGSGQYVNKIDPNRGY